MDEQAWSKLGPHFTWAAGLASQFWNQPANFCSIKSKVDFKFSNRDALILRNLCEEHSRRDPYYELFSISARQSNSAVCLFVGTPLLVFRTKDTFNRTKQSLVTRTMNSEIESRTYCIGRNPRNRSQQGHQQEGHHFCG